MSQILEVVHRLQSMQVNPLAVVIVAALLAAFLEQRIARRDTVDFNAAYREKFEYPNVPQRGRRRRKARAGK